MKTITFGYLFQIAFKIVQVSIQIIIILYCQTYIIKRAIDHIYEDYKDYAILDINITLIKHEDPCILLNIISKLMPK